MITHVIMFHFCTVTHYNGALTDFPTTPAEYRPHIHIFSPDSAHQRTLSVSHAYFQRKYKQLSQRATECGKMGFVSLTRSGVTVGFLPQGSMDSIKLEEK